MFALIMTIGLIVDDSIVVSENAYANQKQGYSAEFSALLAAKNMFVPILAGSLTSIGAFIPLLVLGGVLGELLTPIPIVMTSVIIASMIECFLVLPTHLRHSLKDATHTSYNKWRDKTESIISYTQNVVLKKLLVITTKNNCLVASVAFSFLLAALILLYAGVVKVNVFPTTPGTDIEINMRLVAGLTEEEYRQTVQQFESALEAVKKETGQDVLVNYVIRQNIARFRQFYDEQGQRYLSIFVELSEPNDRVLTNQEFIDIWRSHISGLSSI
jgi:multidrug efflux pump subunit AcrB